MNFKVSKITEDLVSSISNLVQNDIGKWCLLIDNVFVFMSPDLDAVNDMKDSMIRDLLNQNKNS